MFIDKYEHYSQWFMGVCYDVLIAIKIMIIRRLHKTSECLMQLYSCSNVIVDN